MEFHIRRADKGDREKIIELYDEAARWLSSKGIDQWAVPWPSRQARERRVDQGIAHGKTWLVCDGPRVAATVTVYEQDSLGLLPSVYRGSGVMVPDLWRTVPGLAQEPAHYLYRLIVARSYEGHGLGSRILDWVGDRAARDQADWVRLDVWTTNTALHDYYQHRGFEHVYTVGDHLLSAIDLAGCPSAALFQRKAKRVESAPFADKFTEVNGDGKPAHGQWLTGLRQQRPAGRREPGDFTARCVRR